MKMGTIRSPFPMMPQPGACPNWEICDNLRSCTAPALLLGRSKAGAATIEDAPDYRVALAKIVNPFKKFVLGKDCQLR